MSKTIAINAGSSSLKWQLYQMPNEEVIAKGIVERIGLKDSIFTIKYGEGQKYEVIVDIDNHEVAVKMLLDQLIDLNILGSYDEITGVGHRVVAGGEEFKDSVVITDEVLEKIEALSELAPLHNPANAMGIKAFKHILPEIISVAVFDTSFHTTMPEHNYLYSVPREYYEKFAARKYGAHGTSHRYVSQRAAEMLGRPIEDLKIITCHLGNGASITAVDGGKSVDTSMGFTPLAGVTMGTRSGDVDVTVMNGVDAIVFTAGIGENAVGVRKDIIDGMTWFGCEIDDDKNNVHGEEAVISTDDSKIKLLLVPTDEELMIARDVERLK